MYADRITNSMKRTIDGTNRKREKQQAYNKKNGLTPQPLIQKKRNSLTDSLNPYKITGPSTNKRN